MLTISGKNCIGYADSAMGAQTFQAVNPALDESFGISFVQATADEVDLVVSKADEAFRVWSLSSLQYRVDFLKGIAVSVRKHAAQLTHWYCEETGLPLSRAKAELERSCFQFESYAEAIANGFALSIRIDPSSGPGKPDLRKMNVPLGPVVVFGASNFPFAYSTLGGDVASALAAGCPVIVKAHPMHPHTSELSARIILSVAREMGLPDGIFSHLQAIDYKVGEQLVLHPQVKAVGFTGSIQGGTTLVRLANSRVVPIPVYAEMGSSNPMMFTTDALANRGESIAKEVAASIGLSAGQFCTSPGLLFMVDSAPAKEFLFTLSALLQQTEPQVMLHPGIFKQYEHQASGQLEESEILVNGLRSRNTIQPSLVRISGRQLLREPGRADEVFGSFATAIVCENETELISCLNALSGQLTAGLYIESNENGALLLSTVQRFAGRIILNGVPTGVAVSAAMQHGGPFPSSSLPSSTAVGADAIQRFMRPICFQNVTDDLLPNPLKFANPDRVLRFVNGLFTDAPC
ncbi:MAG: aldehyde dehydrogenase (NADP(+)) [Fluviicola sp.]|nr:aldehyde dehydrogenase (NADP(+)) [Fluviicola sp.]